MGLVSTLKVKILDKKVAPDISLEERGGRTKFGCSGSYRIPMYNEETNILLYILHSKITITSRLCSIEKKLIGSDVGNAL
jgi:hypothetical protein